MAIQYNRKVIIYYGTSGHGKGLVDDMSAFGVKGPLLKAVLTEKFTYSSSTDIHTYLTQRFAGDDQKKYYVIPPDETTTRRETTGCVCDSLHMICFNSDGSIFSKVNICSCKECLEGKGRGAGDSDEETDSEKDDEDDEIREEEDDLEQYELRSEDVVHLVEPGNAVALFSPSSALELFYLCKVIECGVVTEDLSDKSGQSIAAGIPYLLVHYYEKKQIVNSAKIAMLFINYFKNNLCMCYLPKLWTCK